MLSLVIIAGVACGIYMSYQGKYDNQENMKGYDRYIAIESSINPDGNNAEGVMNKEKGLEVLELVGRRKWDNMNGKSDKNTITVWSALYNLTY